MGRIYYRSWRRRKLLALSLGVGVVAAFVLPAFGQDGDDKHGTAVGLARFEAGDGWKARPGDLGGLTFDAGRVYILLHEWYYSSVVKLASASPRTRLDDTDVRARTRPVRKTRYQQRYQ